MNSQLKKVLLLLVLVLAIIAVSIELVDFFYGEQKGLQVHFFDIGQGDATLLNLDGSNQILVDGGPSGERLLAQLGAAISPFDRKLELVILTHPDRDHLAGLIDVVQTYEIGLFLHNGQNAQTEVFQQLKEVLAENQVRQEIFGEGSDISFGNQLSIKSYNPDQTLDEQSDRNEHSLVLRIDYGGNSFLITGDADEQTEDDMIADLENIDVDWLKVGHHGSDSSTTDQFLHLVTPEYAVISAGKGNRYGHPDQQVLERLENVGAEILRTDQKGTIVVECASVQLPCELR